MSSSNSSSRIIRGKGKQIHQTIYCHPEEHSLKEEEQEQEQLRALETFWENRGIEKGRKLGREEGQREGNEIGYQRGLREGREQGRNGGREEGYLAGKEKGERELYDSLEKQFALLCDLKREWLQKRDHLLKEMKPEWIQLALAISKKILQAELQNPKSFIEHLERIFEGAQKIMKKQSISIQISLKDWEKMQDHLREMDLSSYQIEEWKWEIEKEFPEGSIRIQSPLGIFSFDIGAELERVEKALLGESSSSQESSRPQVSIV